MLDVLIVENDPVLARTLKDLVEIRPCRRVTDIAVGLVDALESIDRNVPHIALIDINLTGGATGIEVATHIRDLGIRCLFMAVDPLPFPVPEIALGCLCKPYDCYSVDLSLSIVEKIIAGDPVNADVPLELEIY